jgi:hypothetical protein
VRNQTLRQRLLSFSCVDTRPALTKLRRASIGGRLIANRKHHVTAHRGWQSRRLDGAIPYLHSGRKEPSCGIRMPGQLQQERPTLARPTFHPVAFPSSRVQLQGSWICRAEQRQIIHGLAVYQGAELAGFGLDRRCCSPVHLQDLLHRSDGELSIRTNACATVSAVESNVMVLTPDFPMTTLYTPGAKLVSVLGS